MALRTVQRHCSALLALLLKLLTQQQAQQCSHLPKGMMSKKSEEQEEQGE
jgi:hypothetical protein